MMMLPYGARLTRPVVMGRSGTVVSGHHLASQAGLDVLRAGGNAMDAAIATAAALAVLKPDACGLGSDLFLLYSDARSGEVHALNASGTAPAAANPDAFGDAIPELGIRAAAVPGAIHGWENAIARFGRMPLAHVLAPAIALARDGFPVSLLFAATLAQSGHVFDRFPETAAIFRPGGRLPQPGENLVQHDAQRVLEAVARDGSAAYYEGAFAQALDAHARANGGLLRARDLRGYRSEWRAPLRVEYAGVELVAQPPVSVGFVVLQCLKLLERTPIASLPDGSAEFIHLHVEAMKLAGADLRGHVADPNFVADVPIAELLSPAYVARRAREIDPARAQRFAPGALGGRPPSDTSYSAVIDAEGNAVSLLQSVFAVFGCGEVVPETGVLMNNRMSGFSLDPSSPNVVAPGKRTMHTLNPHMIRRRGRFWTALGTPGGPSQTYTNTLLIQRLVDRELDVQAAVEAPRWFLTPDGRLHVESPIGSDVVEELRRRGHEVVVDPPLYVAMGGAGVARINAGGIRESGADPRRDTYALAY